MRTATGHSAFDIALQQVRSADVRPEFRLDEVPAPQRLAPDAVALTAERIDVEDESAYGRFVLLHDPDGVEEWEGTFRAVVFIRAELDSEVLDDPLIQDVAWSWLRDALATTDARAIQVGGTITRTSGKSFGTMEDRPADGFLEIRASWTPEPQADDLMCDLGHHVQAWLELLAHAVGLPPVPEGVTHVGSHRRRRMSP